MKRLQITASLLGFILLILNSETMAAAPSPLNEKLEACLKKAEELPDMADANAQAWLKQGGGEDARFCRAAALFNEGEFAASAEEFSALAKLHETNDAHHAADLHARAGLSHMRSNENARAEAEYAAALALEQNDPEIWVDRATERASVERYWDALADLNHALEIMPDMTEALHLRGQVWVKLGNRGNAEADFAAAEQIQAQEMSGTSQQAAPAAPVPAETKTP